MSRYLSFVLTFAGWALSQVLDAVNDVNAVLQALIPALQAIVLLVSLTVGLIGLLKTGKKKEP